MSKRLSQCDFLERSKEIHGVKYNYSLSEYVSSSKKVKIICSEHGEFEQLPSDHLRGMGCRKCARLSNGKNKRIGTDEFVKRCRITHGDIYDYSEVEYKTSNDNVIIICKEHGKFEQLPNVHLSGIGCRKCSYEVRKDALRDDTNSFIKKARSVHGDEYDYSNVIYKTNDQLVDIQCKKHGTFKCAPSLHINSASGCPKCKGEKLSKLNRSTTDEFIRKSILKHGNLYDYSFVNYTIAHDKVDIVCKKHGTFQIRAYDHLNGKGCQSCSKSDTKAEVEIRQLLSDYGVSYIKNHRQLIKPLEVDLYIPDHKLAIEYNGHYFHSEIQGKDRQYHITKTKRCEIEGVRLIHIFEGEWIKNSNLVKHKIKNILGLNRHKIFARKCEIREISKDVKKKFNEKYHIQGDTVSCINLGLFYKNRLVQVMTFSKLRKSLGNASKEGSYELARVSSVRGFNIIGGSSKLLKYFERTYNPTYLLSYADRRWSVGDVYHKLGFTLTKISQPNYWYFHKSNTLKLYHRYKFAKHHLNKLLGKYNPDDSEWINMMNNGYDRIWDCGNYVFVKHYNV
jgi:very-short-patch-repair endonuclease/predicted Zn-ribbon and HTH transcriptional regulator